MKRALLVIGLTVVTAGCSSHMMPIHYEASGVVPVDVSEKVHVGHVADSRGTPSNWLGAIRGGYGNPLKKLYTDQPTATVVQAAFEDALRVRNLLGDSAAAAYRLDVELEKFDTSYYFNKEAHADLTISLVHSGTGMEVFQESYQTDNVRGGAGAGIFGDVEALAEFANETLNQTIDKALDDPRLVGALQPRPAAADGESVSSRLQELDRLRSDGLITADEYETKRQEIIGEL